VMLMLLPIGYAFVLGGAFLVSWFCYKVPPFGILIGRPQWHLSKLKKSPKTKGAIENVKNNESIKHAIRE